MVYLISIILLLVGIGAGFGAFFLVRLISRTFKEKRIAKGVGLSIAAFLVILIALIHIISGFGWLITALL